MRSILGAVLAAALLAVAAVPLGQAQDPDNEGNSITITGARAEGRFVGFGLDAEAGAICDWSFEGRPVLLSVSGVGAQARAHGRSVVVEGDVGDTQARVCADAQAGEDDAGGDEDAGNQTDPQGNQTGNQTSTGGTTNGTGAEDDEDADEEDDGDQDDGEDAPEGDRGGATRARLTLHDNPSGAIRLDLRDGQVVRLDFDPSLRVSADDDRILVRGDGLRASLALAKGGLGVDVDVEGSTVTLRGLGDAKVNFRVDDADLDDDEGEQFSENRDNEDVACEVFVSDDDRPHVVEVGGANVTVLSAVHTSVSVNLSIDLDVDVDIGGDGEDSPPQSTTTTTTATRTETQTTTRTETQTQTTTTTASGGTTGSRTSWEGCGCAARVIILDVDVTVVVLEADDDLLVSLDGVLLAKADSVEDALTVEAGEDPEALVVVNQQQEVKVLLAMAPGQHDVSLRAQEGETFQTREPQRAPPQATTRTTTLEGDDGDDGRLPVNEVDVDAESDQGSDAAADGQGANDPEISVPGFEAAVAVFGVLAAVALLAARRRFD